MKILNNNFSQALDISFKPNNKIAIALALLHLFVAIIFITATQLPLYILFITILSLFISYLYYYLWHVSYSLSKSIIQLKMNTSGEWTLVNSKNKTIKVTLQPSSFVSQYLLLLNFNSPNNKQYTVLIEKSMVSRDEYRYLKVRLKTS